MRVFAALEQVAVADWGFEILDWEAAGVPHGQHVPPGVVGVGFHEVPARIREAMHRPLDVGDGVVGRGRGTAVARDGEQVVDPRPPDVGAEQSAAGIEIRHAVGAVVNVPDRRAAGGGRGAASERVVGVGLQKFSRQ